MKIQRVEAAAAAPAAIRQRRAFRTWMSAWYVQAALLLAAFLLGAVVYRSGIVRPVTEYLRGLAAAGPFMQKLPAPVQEAAKNVQDESRLYLNNGLPTLYIDLKFKYYTKLLEKRDEAIKLGILNTTDADFVPAQVSLALGGPKMDTEMRLKGDWTDHLEGDKWSFRFKMKGEGQVMGMKEFNLQTPAARNFLNEWAFHQDLIKEGVLTTRYRFVNLLLNGKLLGIYAIEEHFAPELIESQGRRQGLIIRFNEDLMWDNMTNFWASSIFQESNLSVTSEQSAPIDAFKENKIVKDPTLSEEAQAAKNLLRAFQDGTLPASKVFDVTLTGRYFAMHDLWDAAHGVAWHNLRFYYNPVTARLEPIAYDGEPFDVHDPMANISDTFIETRIFNDPQIRAAYARELYRITQPGYITDLKKALSPEHNALLSALKIEFPLTASYDTKSVPVDWSLLARRAKMLQIELQPADVMRGTYQALNVLPGAQGKPALSLDLVNLMMLPLDVQRVEIDGKTAAAASLPATLAPVMDPQNNRFDPTRIDIPLQGDEGFDGKKAPKVEVVAKISGLPKEFRLELTGGTLPTDLKIGPAPVQPTVAEAANQHAFLQADPQVRNRMLVTPGVWDVDGDLILPADTDLVVPAGTQLRFSHGSILYISGSLNLLGAEGAPVLLTAQKDTWGGIVVMNTPRDSLWTYASVEKTGGISRSGWVMTGGITFYKSTIVLQHTLLGNNKTEDAINVIHGTFRFSDCEFENTQADALDSDFSTGEITNCYFHDISGDAVDVSGTKATVSGSRLERITDKGVSVGEQSDITVKDTKMDTVGIGVASKDLSKALVTNTEIRKARFSALAAYIKKPVYGPASIDAQKITVVDTGKTSVAQTGSTITIDGKAQPTQDLDVEKLYAEGILGN